MPIFCVESVKIYTGQKKFTRIYPWDPWQISGMTSISDGIFSWNKRYQPVVSKHSCLCAPSTIYDSINFPFSLSWDGFFCILFLFIFLVEMDAGLKLRCMESVVGAKLRPRAWYNSLAFNDILLNLLYLSESSFGFRSTSHPPGQITHKTRNQCIHLISLSVESYYKLRAYIWPRSNELHLL